MLDISLLDNLVTKLLNVVPDELHTVRQEMQKNFKMILQQYFAQMDLVTREDFDIQSAVLIKTRQKLEALAQQVNTLEQQLSSNTLP